MHIQRYINNLGALHDEESAVAIAFELSFGKRGKHLYTGLLK
jgi:hypothetical protein